MIKFDSNKLAAVAVAQSTEETRYYLRGVFFTGHIAVATNGHIMTVGRDARMIDGDFVKNDEGIFPISKKAQTTMKKAQAESVKIDDGVLTVVDSMESVLHMEPCEPIDGTFPDWRRVIPNTETELTSNHGTFNHVYFAKIAETAKILSKSETGVKILGEDPTKSHLVNYINNEVFSVIMPMRDTIETGVPSWVEVSKNES